MMYVHQEVYLSHSCAGLVHHEGIPGVMRHIPAALVMNKLWPSGPNTLCPAALGSGHPRGLVYGAHVATLKTELDVIKAFLA